MRKTAPPDPTAIDAVFQFRRGALTADQKLQLLAQWRDHEETSRLLDQKFIDQLAFLHQSLTEARRIHGELEHLLKQFNAPPWFPATVLKVVPGPDGPRADVQHGSSRRVVVFDRNLDPASVRTGDEVYLTREMNMVAAISPNTLPAGGEICLFERRLPNDRLVVKIRDEEFVVVATPALIEVDLRPGDPLIWNRETRVAFERVARPPDSRHFLEESPRETFDSVGGLDPQIAAIQRCVNLHRVHGPAAEKYRLRRAGSILLVGPPGTGKTLLAKGLANSMGQRSGTGRSLFMNIKPGALHSVWYSQSESNYRELFRVARELSAQNPGVPLIMFFDEVDSIASTRGVSHMRVHDNVLTAFIAELDGLEARGDILVVAATNRLDALDPALVRPGRLGDLILHVPRPNPKAARDILARHLRSDIPYARNGHGPDLAATREELLDAAVSRIYAPNGDNHLATLTFRDGRREPLRASDLVNGAVLANVVRRASERACVRDIETGREGLTAEDVEVAIAEEFEQAVRALTPANCRQHLAGLPQDMDVVKIERAPRRVPRPHVYLNPMTP